MVRMYPVQVGKRGRAAAAAVRTTPPGWRAGKPSRPRHRDRRSSARGHCSSSKKKTRRAHALPFLCQTRCPPWTDRASLYAGMSKSKDSRDLGNKKPRRKENKKHVRGACNHTRRLCSGLAAACARNSLWRAGSKRLVRDSGGTYRGWFTALSSGRMGWGFTGQKGRRAQVDCRRTPSTTLIGPAALSKLDDDAVTSSPALGFLRRA